MVKVTYLWKLKNNRLLKHFWPFVFCIRNCRPVVTFRVTGRIQRGPTYKMLSVLFGTNQCPHQMFAFRKRIWRGHWQASCTAQTSAPRMQSGQMLGGTRRQMYGWGMGSSLWFVPSMTQHSFGQSPQELLVSWELWWSPWASQWPGPGCLGTTVNERVSRDRKGLRSGCCCGLGTVRALFVLHIIFKPREHPSLFPCVLLPLFLKVYCRGGSIILAERLKFEVGITAEISHNVESGQ